MNINDDIFEYINSGCYKIADLDIIKKSLLYEMSDKINDHIIYTNDLLFEHLSELSSLVDEKSLGDNFSLLDDYLVYIKNADILDNHNLEKENSFILGMHYIADKEKAIDKFIEVCKSNKNFLSSDMFSFHNLLLYGTSSYADNIIRDNNTKFVGRFENGKRIIDYFPLDYKDVPVAMDMICDICNLNTEVQAFDNLFFRPFLVHGLFGALQLFNDGNTRMGRLIQHVLLWDNINNYTSFSFDMPPLYATRSYYPFRKEYRDKISKLVVSGDNESWEDWFDFNLNRIEDQIYMGNYNLVELKRRIRK